MQEVDAWFPINFKSPYNLEISFDGNGKTIRNFKCTGVEQAGFFGVLNG